MKKNANRSSPEFKDARFELGKATEFANCARLCASVLYLQVRSVPSIQFWPSVHIKSQRIQQLSCSKSACGFWNDHEHSMGRGLFARCFGTTKAVGEAERSANTSTVQQEAPATGLQLVGCELAATEWHIQTHQPAPRLAGRSHEVDTHRCSAVAC